MHWRMMRAYLIDHARPRFTDDAQQNAAPEDVPEAGQPGFQMMPMSDEVRRYVDSLGPPDA